jgi:hypothetical protein
MPVFAFQMYKCFVCSSRGDSAEVLEIPSFIASDLFFSTTACPLVISAFQGSF